MSEHTPRTRDAALRKLRSLNRWVIAGSAALTGIFTAVAASAFPGKTLKAGASAAGTQTRSPHVPSRAGSTESLRPPKSSPEASEEEAPSREAGEAASPSEPSTESSEAGGSGAAPGEEATTAPKEGAVETEKPAEVEKPVEAAPEAPVVSGGS